MPPRSPQPSPSRRRKGPRPPSGPARAGRRPGLGWTPRARLAAAAGFFVAAVSIGGAITARTWRLDRPARLLAEARAATDAADLPRALAAWHAWNEEGAPTGATLVIEAQLAGELGRGGASAAVARAATRVDPASAAAWVLRINRLRVLDRSVEALELGLAALGRVADPDGRRAVLRATTLATLAEVPDAEARARLDRWIAADPADLDARVARLARIAAGPHPGDPDRAERIAELQGLLDRDPAQGAAREALAVALADAGQVARGRDVVAAWPRAAPDLADPGADARDRDPRFRRLQARWDLEYDHQPARAEAGFRASLAAFPHDWKAHYGLARALRTLGRGDEAEGEARAVARLRERLDPITLGPRLTADLDRLAASPAEAAAAMRDLAATCRNVGLARLAAAWDRAAAETAPVPSP